MLLKLSYLQGKRSKNPTWNSFVSMPSSDTDSNQHRRCAPLGKGSSSSNSGSKFTYVTHHCFYSHPHPPPNSLSLSLFQIVSWLNLCQWAFLQSSSYMTLCWSQIDLFSFLCFLSFLGGYLIIYKDSDQYFK